MACVVGDGEAETGALATSWHTNKFLNPVGDGAVLPILHLNGYKIANPTVLARIPEPELTALFTGYGYRPMLVQGGFDDEDPMLVHERMAKAFDTAFDEIRRDLGRGPVGSGPGASGVAHDHPAHPQGLDGAEVRRRRCCGRDVAGPSGPPGRGSDQPGPSSAARGVDAQLPPRGALRRRRCPCG